MSGEERARDERLDERDQTDLRTARPEHLLVIGAQRCGTTYLHALLDGHPQITMARPARPEPKVFCSDELADRGSDWYRATYFSHARGERLLGEKSTSYLEDPLAPERARRMLGSTQIAVMLRDPVDRAVSNWRFSTDNGFESRPLERALHENLDAPAAWDPTATSVSPFAYVERGRYADYLRPWLETFAGTTHVWFLADLSGDRDAVRSVYADLGVDPEAGTYTDQAVNASSEPLPALPADLVESLRAYYADADEELGRMLNRELPWRVDVGGANV